MISRDVSDRWLVVTGERAAKHDEVIHELKIATRELKDAGVN